MQRSIGAMVFYSILTFFFRSGRDATFYYHPDQCVFGYLLGFTVHIFLWMKYGRKLAKK